MLLTGKVYDVTKRIAQVWLPALGTLYFALAQLWHLPAPEEVVGSVLAVDTFMGVVLGISSSAYNASDQKFAGTMELTEGEDGTSMRLLGVDPAKLLDRPEVVFKMTKAP